MWASLTLQATPLPGAKAAALGHLAPGQEGKTNPGPVSWTQQDDSLHLVIVRGMLGTRVPGADNPAQGDTYTGAALQSPAEKAKDSGSFCAACFCSLLEDSGRNGRDFQIWDPLLVAVMWQGWGTLVHFGHYPCETVA